MSDNKKSSFRLVKLGLFWVLFSVFIGVSCWLLFLSEYTKIEKPELISSEKINKEALNNILVEKNQGKRFGYLPKNNFFLFPRKEIKKEIKEEFELVREVIFENKFPNKISVRIDEREGIIIFCNQSQCFLLDEEGLIFRKINLDEKDEKFKNYLVINSGGHSKVEEKNKINPENLISLIQEIKDKLKDELDIEIEREMETPALISKELRVKTKEGWQIYFNLEEKIIDQIALLKEILDSSIQKEEKEKLNYIDLRIPNKAIYNSSF